MDELLAGLNPQQRQAVTAADGPVLVLAGPGSGKTRVLVHRVAWLLRTCQPPLQSVMAVTFTNKAAREMRDRLTQLMGVGEVSSLAVGTFHSLCARLLRREAEAAGLSRDFTIFDSDDQLALMKSVLKSLNLDEKKFRPSAIHAAISRAKNELIPAEAYPVQSYFDEIVQRAYVQYNALLRANNALDFDDLLMESVLLLQRDARLLQRVRERYAHVLVDEFQDTNTAQYVLVKLLVGGHRRLFCVGDPDQSIYAWRGADYRNVHRLRQDFPDLRVIPLEQNYRSTQTILDAAMAVIRKNAHRQHINLFTERGRGARIVLREFFDENEEAEYVVETIREIVRRGAAKRGEIAVMYRTNAQSRALEEAFIRAGEPYRLVGATRFYARREIKDALAYLRIIYNPADTVSLQRVINVPPRGIGEKTFAQLDLAARARGLTPLQAIQQGISEGRAAKALAAFAELWQSWIDLSAQVSLVKLFDHVLRTSGYADYLRDGTEEGEDRWENVRELRNVIAEAGDLSLADFLNEVSLVSDIDNFDDQVDAPVLLTLHAAKGLEFRVVFIVGLADGTLPHSRTLDDPEQIAEERRLLYVGITRAKERLYLLYPFRRSAWSDEDVAGPSRFLRDLPPDLIEGNVHTRAESRQSMTRWQTEPPATRTRPTKPRFQPGDRVRHPHFGDGVVLRSAPSGEDEELEVFFPAVGGKRLSANFSGLQKM